MNRLRPAIVALTLAVATLANAKPEFWETFQAHYHPAPNSAIAVGRCITCHQKTGTDRNAYGRSLQELVDASPDKILTVPMLIAVETRDADADGSSNLQEIQAGSLPGDPESKPSATAQPALGIVIPAHSFHPMLVHFPIGIFLFGALLDIFGGLRKRADFRAGARFAILVGAVTILLAVGTGITAMLRMGKPLAGTLLEHFIFALAACILGLTVGAKRLNKEPADLVYWILLTLALVSLTLAGHFGSSMVWG